MILHLCENGLQRSVHRRALLVSHHHSRYRVSRDVRAYPHCALLRFAEPFFTNFFAPASVQGRTERLTSRMRFASAN